VLLIFNYFYICHIFSSVSQLDWFRLTRFKKIEQRAGAFTVLAKKPGFLPAVGG
jgi:hypothetical protein